MVLLSFIHWFNGPAEPIPYVHCFILCIIWYGTVYHIVMPKSGPELKFECELWRTGPKLSPKFRSSGELNAMFDPAFRYTIIQLNVSELGSNQTSPRILYMGCASELGIYFLKNLSRTLSILKITTVTIPLHIYNESNGIIISCIPTWVIKFHVSLATSQPSPVSIFIGG